MKIYLVGGAVRDRMLELPYHEKDWVVTGATPEDMLAAGFQPVTGGFPVFLHPDTGDEYALARRETKVGPGYQGFAVDAGIDVTADELMREGLHGAALGKALRERRLQTVRQALGYS